MNFNHTSQSIFKEAPADMEIVKQPCISTYPDGVFFNAFPFQMHLHKYDKVWAMCYTFDPEAIQDINIERVVCCKMKRGLDPRPVKVRLAPNVHTKLYLCWEYGRLASVFAGSWNLVMPTFLEVIVKLPEAANRQAKEYFLQVWHQGAKP